MNFQLTWADGHDGTYTMTADYKGIDCTLRPLPALRLRGTTRGSAACDTATGLEAIRWSATNTGKVGWRIAGSTFPGGVPSTLIAPGRSLPVQTLVAPGAYKVSTYVVHATAQEGRQLVMGGRLVPAALGDCQKVLSSRPTTPPALLRAWTYPLRFNTARHCRFGESRDARGSRFRGTRRRG